MKITLEEGNFSFVGDTNEPVFLEYFYLRDFERRFDDLCCFIKQALLTAAVLKEQQRKGAER